MSDDSDLRSYTRRGALGLMGAGGVLAATETLGFSNFTRDRNLNIAVTNDLNSLLKVYVENEAIDGQTLNKESVTVYFENQSDIELTDIEIDISNSGGGSVEYYPSFSDATDPLFTISSLSPNATENITISTQSSGTADITLDVSSDTLPELSIELSRGFHIDNSS
ncbi:hypothetical protein [Halorubrum sp. CGM4_25_10-8A]|uniref:hypothetical protein n=1 Tax=Halorubrum sp. CGM4_25_10-8A TaxID=2518116 RepID=UPI0010F8BDB2|nr:hypothetical protein [Halorubrum sp. CGM4_25_10-8A]TKX40013.1 hypothetical protein EXE52_08725 [Halorubrum sp. CGM4_25_10-8A]